MATNIGTTNPIEIKMRKSLSIAHLWNAALFSRKSYLFQQKHDPTIFDNDVCMEYQAYAISSIFSAVSFLDSLINEILLDSADDHTSLSPLSPASIQSIANIPSKARKNGILEKYQAVLSAINVPLFNINTNPYEDAQKLIKLRNRLVHFESEWVGPSSPPQEMEVLSGKFLLNPFMSYAQNPFFPDKCIGHGCTEWALNTAIAFADQFYMNLGVTSKYNHIRNKLATK